MYIVMTACAKTKPSWKWIHPRKRIAIVELKDGFKGTPKMISLRSIGVKRIVHLWECLNVGSTKNCQYFVAMKEAESIVVELNNIKETK